jgi:myo-inositol 2-dehydrogenase/D-chiro-inositol 1-dehydrogenase
MLDFCLFGAGRIGKVHAPNIARHPKARLRYIIDPDLDAARALAEPLGAEALAAGDTAIDDDSIGAVLVCGPTPTHIDQTEAAAQAGKAIFCEKPIGLDIKRVEQCIEVVTRTAVPFYLGFMMRFDPSFREVRDGVRAGAIGHVEQIIIISRDPAPPPIEYINQSGGIFRDSMIHSIDIVRWILDEEPSEAFAMGECIIDPEIGCAGDVDSTMLMLRTPSGTICVLSNARHAPQGAEGCGAQFFGSKGLLRVGTVYPTATDGFGGNGPLARRGFPSFQERFEDAYRIELDHFIDGVLNGTPMETGLEDGRRSLLIADAATKSAQERQPVAIRY